MVDNCIRSHGDAAIPSQGVNFGVGSVAVAVKPGFPRTRFDLTYGSIAAILRGIWEMTALYGSYTLNVGIYVGGVAPGDLKGEASVYIRVGGANDTMDKFTPSSSSTDAAIIAG